MISSRIDLTENRDFSGDSLWHADPKYYKENDIIHRDITAKEIWINDNNRIKLLNELGYKVIIILQSDFQHKEENCVNNAIIKIKEICKI